MSVEKVSKYYDVSKYLKVCISIDSIALFLLLIKHCSCNSEIPATGLACFEHTDVHVNMNANRHCHDALGHAFD